MKGRTIALGESDLRELEWLRGGINGLIVCVRLLGKALEGGALKAATGMTDLGPLLTLADAIDNSEVLDNLIDQEKGR